MRSSGHVAVTGDREDDDDMPRHLVVWMAVVFAVVMSMGVGMCGLGVVGGVRENVKGIMVVLFYVGLFLSYKPPRAKSRPRRPSY